MGGKQLGFGDYEQSTAKKRTKRERFLSEIEAFVPWKPQPPKCMTSPPQLSYCTVRRPCFMGMLDTRELRSDPRCKAEASASGLPCGQASAGPCRIHPKDGWMI